ncbi:aldehyde oxidase 1 [Homo sapiens]|uniref:Aldehyde oxidase n=2 Tax=Homo sapiens TaxID=9606 RepID=AOXA_HUMAN|nr:aldehyde oxidase [Homo sapiens]Q06278.2 RecName: Full=Aldehyde oxidase; AltName: Full=Aldehyde oxidase 1; AltName: Full=Azaheterocycle hydroxylase [Homo sapiens]4UHW_A Chain A, ALDEHYDE OXIDASE [Homo sapiens]4UHX_A Chain A, ALDEHYDE OXIDASE [Homo sapiens]7ORC_A Chain A, Aldehyde oxidase [Homo sapiens]7ORC_B Chain B, Aldehyde oxidase [Homo sapiens]8EMT_A Chain A, Aldehyde oxidase [Homo sapiens]8EMT_B Chain B, Aldehyde oxidase [Homo sapiens]AAI17180.1 Aldehyde oxidase 1 [Homo sapiens]AAI1|eukprot:NP_001150.3 aldehyde oxidase [Homo sapiens]
MDRASELLFYVNGRKVIEKNVDPETMLLPYLRKKLRLTGTKYGCGGGGCGACTVMISRYNPITKRIRHHPANACLIPICSLYGAAVTTVEGIGSTHTRIHPVQERIAKCHGTQCGFCTPGMVMSIYTLLRNHPEPTLDQLTDALGGNLCRCTGYRPIIDACKTFCKTSGCCQSKENGVCCLDQGINGLPEFEEGSKTSPKLFAEEEFLPLDPTQELIFPPELMIMAEKQSQRTRVFGSERMMWFSPVTLKELLEFKFKYPQAPVIMGNTSVGPEVKFKGVFHPVIISPDRIEELSVVNHAYNGLTLGAGLSLAQVKDILADVVQKLPEEKTQMYHALLKHLGTLAGSQIRNMASLGGHIISRHPDSDLNPILAVGNCTLNLLSKEGKRQIPLNEQFLSKCPNADLKPQEILVSVNIPYSRKWEFVSAFRQAQRQENALAIVNSGMRVFFGEGDGIIRELCISYGGVGPATICAKNSCQKLIGRHWNEQMLDIACRLILNEVSLLGSAPGGKVEFKRTLIISFLFKFYLEVSQILKKMDPVHYPSLADKYESALEDLHSKHHCSTLKYQNIGPKQHPEDPIGHPIMHLSGVKHATGEAIYCDDMPLVDQELFLTFVTSSRAHAKIVSIDLSEALSMPGVVDIMTAEHLSDVNSFCFFTEAEKFLATDKVFCVGQLVCAVLADSEVQAKRAAKRVKIVYQDLEPLILTIEESIQHNSSFKPERKLEYGNVDEAFKVVDQILEGEIHMGGQEHFYMETQSMLVVPKGEDQEMDVYVSTQFPKYIQDIVASTLKLPANKVMCHVRRVGGAFGGKVLKTGIIAAVTAFAANKHGRAVRCVLERGEDMLITGGRHPYLGKYKAGFMNDGRILALDMEHYSNAGASLDESLFVIEMGLLKMDNAYKFPNLRCRGWACRTNLPSNTAFRGFGFPQAALITESCITEVAAKCGLSPEKVRIINMYKEIDQTPYKQEINAKNLIQCWRECMAMSSYSLRKVAVEKFNAENYWKKKGLAMVPLKFPVGLGSRAAGQAAALVHIYLDGSVLVTHGGIEMGQGVHTKMIQVVSRELRMPMSNVHLRGTSTETVPNANISGGSVVADLNGLAVKDACQTLLKRLEPIISKNPKGTWKDWAQTAFDESINLSAVGYFRGYESDMNWEKGEGQPFEYFVYGAACSEVEIDCLTGDHKNIRTDIVMDVGCSINPAIDIGQIEGAFIQGMGLYTIEELNYSPQGILHTRGPDQYKIPAICDMPTELHIALLPPSQNSNTLYSSKGLGESGVFLGCSVFFAIHDAVSAARQERGLHGPLTLNSPLTPEKIRMACEDKFTKMIPRDEPGSYVPWNVPI